MFLGRDVARLETTNDVCDIVYLCSTIQASNDCDIVYLCSTIQTSNASQLFCSAITGGG